MSNAVPEPLSSLRTRADRNAASRSLDLVIKAMRNPRSIIDELRALIVADLGNAIVEYEPDDNRYRIRITLASGRAASVLLGVTETELRRVTSGKLQAELAAS